MAQVFIPSLMRDLSQGRASVRVPGATVRAVLRHLAEACPGVEERLFTAEGALQPHIALMVDGGEIAGLDTPVREESEVVIIPALGGG